MKVSKFVRDMRVRLWRDFLGLKEDDKSIEDPVTMEVYRDIWRKTANENTQIYKRVFGKLPDTMYKVTDVNLKLQPQETDLLNQLKGFLIEFPMDFLIDEARLTPTLFDKEFLMPTSVFL